MILRRSPSLITMMMAILVFFPNPRVVAETSSAPKQQGENWALLIGINQYQHFPRLKAPAYDVQSFKKVLIERYSFQEEHVQELYDKDATQSKILETIESLVTKLGRKDSLLIYYAGHGDEDAYGRGFLIPHDAERDKSKKTNWIRPSDLQPRMSKLKCLHSLMILDSCFSNHLLVAMRSSLGEVSDEFMRRAYDLRSREVIASGNVKVMDAEIERHSAFAFYLLDALDSNSNEYLNPSRLHYKLMRAMPDRQPSIGFLKDTGHIETGSYLFFLRPTLPKEIETIWTKAERIEEDEGNTLEHLIKAQTEYKNYRGKIDKDKFKKQIAEADRAIQRLNDAIKGISFFESGDFDKAKQRLDKAAKSYESLPSKIKTKRLVEHWQKLLNIYTIIQDEKLDKALPILKTFSLSKEENDKPSRIALSLRKIVEKWNWLFSTRKAKDFSKKLEQATAHLEIQKQLESLASIKMDEYPSALGDLIRKELKTYSHLIRQIVESRLKEGEQLESLGWFTGETGATKSYKDIQAFAALLKAAGTSKESKKFIRKAVTAQKRCQAMETLMGQRNLEGLTKEFKKLQVGGSSASPSKLYCKKIYPILKSTQQAMDALSAKTIHDLQKTIVSLQELDSKMDIPHRRLHIPKIVFQIKQSLLDQLAKQPKPLNAEELIPEAKKVLSACLSQDSEEERQKLLKDIRLKTKSLLVTKGKWHSFDDSELSSLWRDIQLAYHCGLFRIFEKSGHIKSKEYMYIFDKSESKEAIHLRSRMVWIDYGPNSDKPGFFMDKSEVTMRQFRPFWENERGRGFQNWEGLTNKIRSRLEGYTYASGHHENWPIVEVTYNDAKDFAQWSNLNKYRTNKSYKRRLPTESEWKHAAYHIPGSSDEQQYPWGNDEGLAIKKVNLKEKDIAGNYLDSWDKIVPPEHLEEKSGVGDISPWGVIGLGGNVSEWVTREKPGAQQIPYYLGGNYLSPLNNASKDYLLRRFPKKTSPLYTVGFRCIYELPKDWNSQE